MPFCDEALWVTSITDKYPSDTPQNLIKDHILRNKFNSATSSYDDASRPGDVMNDARIKGKKLLPLSECDDASSANDC